MSKSNEMLKNETAKNTAKNTAKQTANETSVSFIERNKAILLGTLTGLTVAAGLGVVSSLSMVMVAAIGISSSILASYLIDVFYRRNNKDETKSISQSQYIPQSLTKAAALYFSKALSKAISKEPSDDLNFRKHTYKTAYEIQLANAKRNKKNNTVITKFEKLVSEAQKEAPHSEQSAKNLLNVYKRGTEALKHLNDDDSNYFINLKIQELEDLKKKKLKSR
jgi:hypothetical protein